MGGPYGRRRRATKSSYVCVAQGVQQHTDMERGRGLRAGGCRDTRTQLLNRGTQSNWGDAAIEGSAGGGGQWASYKEYCMHLVVQTHRIGEAGAQGPRDELPEVRLEQVEQRGGGAEGQRKASSVRRRPRSRRMRMLRGTATLCWRRLNEPSRPAPGTAGPREALCVRARPCGASGICRSTTTCSVGSPDTCLR